MKILLIEDSRFLRAAIERLLVKAGHEVIGIADGREALPAARTNLPALVLLDMMLPGLDGTCVLKELKQDCLTSHIPIIVMTGLSQKNEAKLRKAGAAGFIEKSSLDLEKNPDGLVQALASFLSIQDNVPCTPGDWSGLTIDVGSDQTDDRVGCLGESA
ncbi:MAG: response regulator [Candidatus Sulfotelmatobacter sp.]|jgi:CheY-like chemotaxis protein